jgi:tetrapyrrole methylase family protein / MazG family protein
VACQRANRVSASLRSKPKADNVFVPMRRHKPKSKRTRRLKAKSTRPPRVGLAFDRLVAVMARLRAPDGCPWDREQTHATLRTYLIEETYEVLDALESADDAKFAEELGDLLLQVLFHAEIAREESRFSIADVIREIHEKMIRRHPHVFGAKRAKDSAEVLRNWELIKADERRALRNEPRGSKNLPALQQPSLLDGVPHNLPALHEAFQLTRRAARIGFDWDCIDGIFAKLDEEADELRQALAATSSTSAGRRVNPRTGSIESELGDLLFVVVNLARFLHVDPEIALKKSSAKFSRRFRSMERLASEQGTALSEVSRPGKESLWDKAKRLEHTSA